LLTDGAFAASQARKPARVRIVHCLTALRVRVDVI
jgi:hypothetical protein